MHGRKGDLRRKALCELAGWSEARFNSMRHEFKARLKEEQDADTVDWIEDSNAAEEQMHERAGWGWFGFFDALLLMLIDDFWREDGISLWEARKIVRSTEFLLCEHWKQVVDGSANIFIGRVYCGGNESAYKLWLGGTLADINRQVETGRYFGEVKPELHDPASVSRIVIVNVTLTFARFRANAEKTNIKISDEFLSGSGFGGEI